MRMAVKWRVKLNDNKAVLVSLFDKPIVIYHHLAPYVKKVKYFGVILDARLRWKASEERKWSLYSSTLKSVGC